MCVFQSWSKDDVRMVRFMDGKEKQVNEQFAIDLIAKQPPTASSKRVVSCDGGGGPLGHPKVYINLVCSVYYLFSVLITNAFVYNFG